jgi:hypothetical protein
MTFTFTAVIKATVAKFNFAACCTHAKCSFRIRLHTKVICFDEFYHSAFVHFSQLALVRRRTHDEVTAHINEVLDR